MKNLKAILILAFFALFSINHAQQKYAVLITGDNNSLNIPQNDRWNYGLPMGNYGYDEFWNDTYLFWELLYDKKDFTNENIYVLYDEGIDLSFPDQDGRYQSGANFPSIPFISDQSSSQSNISATFSTLSNTITDNDFLFVWVMSHGGKDATGSYFYSYDAQKIYDTQLATWLNGINAHKKTVFLSFPSSGGFEDELSMDRTIVLCSNN